MLNWQSSNHYKQNGYESFLITQSLSIADADAIKIGSTQLPCLNNFQDINLHVQIRKLIEHSLLFKLVQPLLNVFWKIKDLPGLLSWYFLLKLRKGLLGILFRFIKQKSLSEALKLVCQPFNVNKGYKADIKSMKAELPTALAGAPWFVSRKSFASLEIYLLVALIVGDFCVLSINSVSI